MLKAISCTLLLLVSACPGVASLAADRPFLHGEILEVHDTARVMMVRTGADTGSSRVVQVIVPRMLLSESPDGMLKLPGCLSSGRHVRIWGDVVPNDAGQFIAEEIRGCGMASCSDPTGVRSRLSRNRGAGVNGELCR